MAEKPLIRIATISDNPDPDWMWIRDLMDNQHKLEWQAFSIAATGANIAWRFQSLARFDGAKALAGAARKQPFDVIVSHGPWATAWTEAMLGKSKGPARHLAFSFNFTDLPSGPRKVLMQRAFKTVDAFAVFTDDEQRLYADYFDIDPKKIFLAPWGVAPPLSSAPPRQIEGAYFAALGGEARDYETLCETARRCPEIQFVAIARPHNFNGLNPPENLDVRFNLPFEDAWGLIYHSTAALIPLRNRETPCGLVSLVGAMHLGKAQIVTDAAGIGDYLEHDRSGLVVPPQDPAAMAAAVRRIQADSALTDRLGAAAKAYASAHCSEAATVGFFNDLLDQWFS